MLKAFYLKNKKTIFLILGLFSLFMLFFYGLNSYYLIDVDETRYVAMAREMLERKNWHTLFLNGNYSCIQFKEHVRTGGQSLAHDTCWT